MEGRDRRQPAVVLVASDEPGALELLGRVVERAGWQPDPAADVDVALERAAERLPRCIVAHLPRTGVGSALAWGEARTLTPGGSLRRTFEIAIADGRLDATEVTALIGRLS